MKMTWKKLGCVFCPDRSQDWMHSHAANPVAESLPNGLVRVYFNSRDSQNRSSIGYLELHLSTTPTIEHVGNQPLLTCGAPGLFDDSGASMGCVVKHRDTRYLYYLGWNLGVTV